MMPNETTNTPILTLDSDAKLETAQSISDLTWHEMDHHLSYWDDSTEILVVNHGNEAAVFCFLDTAKHSG